MRKYTKKFFILSILLILLCTNASYSAEFSDIPHGFWAYKEIDKLTDENLISGYPNNKFLPYKPVTRAEYAAMVIKVLGQENLTVETMYSFNDIDNTNWAWPYVIRAVNLDILKPADDGNFYPDDYITRSEVITFLVNILKSEGITKKETIMALQNFYLDFDDIPDWFKVTAGKAEVLNVIAKEPPRENYLDYDKYVSRAQMAVFLANLKREIDSYIQAKIDEEKSPKIAEGIIIENVSISGDVVTIPAKTVLPVVILGQISSDSSVPGQMFRAKFVNNIVTYEHYILFSKDIILTGKILDTTKSRNFIRNGELIFELSCVSNNNLLTRILAYAECETPNVEASKIKKAGKSVIKGREFKVKDGQIIYVKLINPVRVNIVTGEVFD